MPADATPPAEPSPASPPSAAPATAAPVWFPWLAVGIAGVAFAFVASGHLPDTLQRPFLLTTGLAAVAGWAWGRLGIAQHIPAGRTAALVVWCTLLLGQLLAGWKTHRDRCDYLREKWQFARNDPVVQAMRDALAEGPPDESPADRDQRQQQLADLERDLERGEALREKRLEFTAYLANRLDGIKVKGVQTAPWPAVIWGAELALGATLGTWLALSVLRSGISSRP